MIRGDFDVPFEDDLASSVATRRHLVRSRLGSTLIGVDARSVKEIDDVAGVDRRALGELLDLAQVLGLPTPPGGRLRRVLVVSSGGRAINLVVGDSVRIEAVPLEAIRPVPSFLAAIGFKTGIRQLSIDGGEIGFVVDANALSILLRRAK